MKNNTPRHKRLNRQSRLQAAKCWLHKYNGKNIVRGYSNHFAVDLLCAAKELGMIGIVIDQKNKKELEIDMQNRIRRKELIKLKKSLENQSEELIYLEYWKEFELHEDGSENPF